MNLLKQILCGFIMMTTFSILSQETLASDPNAFLIGGDQGQNTASLTLLPIAIVDVEPDPNNTILFGGVGVEFEAGLPVGSGSLNGTNEDLWLNFTHRADNFQLKSIYVRSNLPLPAGIDISIQIIDTVNSQGVFIANPNTMPVLLTNVNQLIVFDFGSGYSGDGIGNGYQLRYTLNNPEGKTLPDGFEIIYTIE